MLKSKALVPAICMISVLIMFIWSAVEGSFEHSWLAVFAGGILIGLYRPDGRIINGPNSVYGLKEMIVQAKKRNEAVYLTVKRSS